MTSADRNEALERMHKRNLNELKALTVHRELATAAALDYCDRHKVSAPPWLVERASGLILELLKREKGTRRGRVGNAITRYRNDQWDVERWDAVEAIRRVREKTKYDVRLRAE